MLVSLNWLKDYINLDNIDIKEFCSKMIMTGSNLDTYEEIGAGVEKVILGKVLKIEKHPDADKLVVWKVEVGESEPIQIVTGAPNVTEGAYVPVAIIGSKLPIEDKNGKSVEIKKGKLRGVESFGMMCGAQELGIPDKVVPMEIKNGLWVLTGDWDDKIGLDFIDALELKDYVIDFEITSNRADCLSMIGMAKEASVTFKRPVKMPNTHVIGNDENISDYISVEINSKLCRRYTARVIKDVKIEPSPWWIQKRLMAAGMRPINNIVDITNFVMLEYGQPLHAFDIENLSDRKIVIDMASEGEKFTTLDGSERVLTAGMLMINDGEKPVAIAGIMGGLNSEVTADTATIVLESANFDGHSVRMTSKRLGLRTEASGRYEKGVDPNLCEEASNRACHLIEKLGCGTVVKGIADVYDYPYQSQQITVRVSKINNVIGTDLSREEMVDILERLGVKVEGSGDDMIVTPPTFRGDLKIEVDYVEEIARIYGYDKIPMSFPKEVTTEIPNKNWDMREAARDILCGIGVNEIQTSSFTNEKILDNMNIDEDSWERYLVELINPMGEDTAAMRSILTAGMLEVLGRNFARNIPEVRAFEIGTTFIKNLLNEEELPTESTHLSIGAYGKDEDFFTMKGIVEEMLGSFGFEKVELVPESGYKLYHPGRCARILVDMGEKNRKNKERMMDSIKAQIDMENRFDSRNGDEIRIMKELMETLRTVAHEDKVEVGIMGEFHPDVQERYGMATRAYGCEMIFDLIVDIADKKIAYEALPKFPAMVRDIAVIVDDEIPVGRLVDIIENFDHEIIEDVKIFDIYRGNQVEEGKKSVALSITYRHKDKTLTDEETTKVHNKILEILNREVNAVLRDI